MLRATWLAFSLALAALATFLPTATAASLEIDDPNRDGQQGSALDITSVRISNNDHAIVTRVAFRRVTTGTLAIYYKPVGSPRDVVQVVSEHRPRADHNTVTTIAGSQECAGLKVRWDHRRDVVRVRLPASCVRDGDYTDLRVRLITEIGMDADIAPSTPRGAWPWSAVIPRG